MSLRAEWQRALDSEVNRWSALSAGQFVSELPDGLLEYRIEFDSKQYNVEVELLENTGDYVHAVVAGDDGSLPASITPLGQSLIRPKASAAV
jgi:hypothetical protein